MDKAFSIRTKSETETQNIASEIANFLSGGEILLLEGELGGGKTTFVQGLAKALGVKKDITSPSFILKQSFSTKKGLDLVHIDLYRLKDEIDNELFEELGDSKTVVVVEWGGKMKKYLKDYLIIKFSLGERENYRKISLSAVGPKAKKLFLKFKK